MNNNKTQNNSKNGAKPYVSKLHQMRGALYRGTPNSITTPASITPPTNELTRNNMKTLGEKNQRPGSRLGYFLILIVGLIMGSLAAFLGHAPHTSPYFEDWKDWARIESVASGMLILGVILSIFGLISLIFSLFQNGHKGDSSDASDRGLERVAGLPNKANKPVIEDAEFSPIGVASLNPHPNMGEVASAQNNLAKDSDLVSTQAPSSTYPDNGADSFSSHSPEDSSAQIIALHASVHPQEQVETPPSTDAHFLTSVPETAGPFSPLPRSDTPITAPDPIAQALLAEAPIADNSPPPKSDIQAIMNSTLSLMAEASQLADPTPIKLSEPEPSHTLATPQHNQDPHAAIAHSAIAQACQMALSVWPDETRDFVREELSQRLSFLYHVKDERSHSIFNQIGMGDMLGAASNLQNLADAKTIAGHSAEAAELWRVYGALHMGRDDPRAMMAYERVSALDPSDGNIHLYLARRYEAEGKHEAQATALGRALGVVSEPEIRLGLLQQFGDLTLKSGNTDMAAKAFEELSHIQGEFASRDADNLHLNSTHAISLARLAQIKELQGQPKQASQLYHQAHAVFAKLSARIPEHGGLKAMASKALNDALRLSA